MPYYSKDNLPVGEYKVYKKVPVITAIQVSGPFYVETKEGVLYCEDGYLALDIQGNPYPIDREIFESTYESV